jgi:predicted TIM-barrel fold metal-dependent hydrolase
MPRQYQAISADSHVDSDRNTYVDYMPQKYLDAAPRLESTDEGDFWVVGDQKQPMIGLSNMAGRKVEDISLKLPRRTYGREGAWDPHERLKDLDTDGVDAEVLFGAVVGGNTPDPALQMAIHHAFNAWLGDFCKVAPDRFLGLGVLPELKDMEAALAELRHIKDAGLKGVWVPTFTNQTPDWVDPVYDPFWAACVDLDLPVHFHLGTGRGAVLEPGNGLSESFITKTTICLFEPLSDVIFTGLFDRFPELQLMLVEGNIAWLAYFLERADHVHNLHRHWAKAPIRKMPSEYFHGNVGATFIRDRVGVKIRHDIGLDNILWSTDYPHSDTTWPKSMEIARQHFEEQGVPPTERHQMLAGNAVRIYNLN